MAVVVLALVFVVLVALLHREGRIDPRPVITHPRWPFLMIGAGAAAAALAGDAGIFLIACALLGAMGALLCERFRLTPEGIEVRGAVLAWGTLLLRQKRWYLDVRTTRGQHVRFPRWMDGLGTLTRMAGSPDR